MKQRFCATKAISGVFFAEATKSKRQSRGTFCYKADIGCWRIARQRSSGDSIQMVQRKLLQETDDERVRHRGEKRGANGSDNHLVVVGPRREIRTMLR